MWESPPLCKLQEAVASPSSPVGMRMRAAYFLRQAYDNAVRNDDDDVVVAVVLHTLASGLRERKHGSLLRHEFAYVMGQLRDVRCRAALEDVLSDDADCVMVRHECAEALAAIGDARSIEVLERAGRRNPDVPEIAQTCEIAVTFLHWRADADRNEEDQPTACACMLSPYSSVDPAPPHPRHVRLTTPAIGEILRDARLPLFERYRAMFSLRNRGGRDAVLELGETLVTDDSSALLRHEVAYVMGQMQHPASVRHLGDSLRRAREHPIVRHEAAEALGAIEGEWDRCESILREFLDDDDIVVRESCAVALDAADYWGHGNDHDNNENDHDNEHCDEKKEEQPAELTFVQRKAVTNGKRKDLGKQVSLNHFNTVQD